MDSAVRWRRPAQCTTSPAPADPRRRRVGIGALGVNGQGYAQYLKSVVQLAPQARQAVATVWAIPEIKTAQGHGRAFVKFALIERRLDQYLNVRAFRSARYLARCRANQADTALLPGLCALG